MDVVDLRPDLRMLIEPPGQAYLLQHAGGVLLVDTGPVGSGATVAAALRDWGLDRDALTHVVLTHWHADHAGSADEIGRWHGVEVLAHHADAPVVRGERPGAPAVLSAAEEVLLARVSAGLPDAPPARVDRELDDGEVIAPFGGRVVATPGHTDGSMALHVVDAGVLFTGDIAAESEGAVILGPFNVDREQARRSFRRLAGLDADLVCFGHGRPLAGADVAALHEAVAADPVPDPLG